MIAVWHGHHNILISWLESIEDRVQDIKDHKPKSEHMLRLKLIKPVKGKLPAAVLKAGDAYSKAGGAAYDKAWDAYSKARGAYHKARDAAYTKARDAFSKARDVYDKAVADNLPAIEALHAKECPNCPWNGKTIFPKERELWPSRV